MYTIPKELIRKIAKQENIKTAQDLNNYFKNLLKEFIAGITIGMSFRLFQISGRDKEDNVHYKYNRECPPAVQESYQDESCIYLGSGTGKNALFSGSECNEKMDYEAEELGFSIKSAVDIF